MKRRKFIRNIGAGITPSLIPFSTNLKSEDTQGIPSYEYRQPSTLKEAVTKDGHVIIRLEFRSDARNATRIKPEIKIEKSHLLRYKNYFFEAGEDGFLAGPDHPVISSHEGDIDIIVLWLDEYA